ncbi:vWA domain-containing protein [Mariniblastus fucicola]|nr:vWA domain-containing protein [Mariniblastus fucicola]
MLPKSKLQFGAKERRLDPPSRWMETALSMFSALLIHILALIPLALIPWGDFSTGDMGEGDQILISQLSREQLVQTPTEKLQNVEIENPLDDSQSDSLESGLFSPLSESPLSMEEFDVTIGAPVSGGSLSFNIESLNQESVMAGGREDFGKMVSRLKKDGLDICIVFDSTGSMQKEIDQVKNRIERIGNTLFKLIPRTRISVCTYRDNGDEFIVKGQVLTDKLGKVVTFLSDISAAGGGDDPEAVDAGLAWAISQNSWRRSARKVVLVFGDAPPHASKVNDCQKLASDFRHQQRGIVSTVTCRQKKPLDAFTRIAQVGGGESFLSRDERQIVTQLMILVFGSKHRRKVIEAFDLMEN